jgi:hypothetical protein
MAISSPRERRRLMPPKLQNEMPHNVVKEPLAHSRRDDLEAVRRGDLVEVRRRAVIAQAARGEYIKKMKKRFRLLVSLVSVHWM